jgi:hypothetical protein
MIRRREQFILGRKWAPLKRLVKGCCVGGCIDGPPLSRTQIAHAHNGPKSHYRGWICFRNRNAVVYQGRLTSTFWHEVAHLIVPGFHNARWKAVYRLLLELTRGK